MEAEEQKKMEKKKANKPTNQNCYTSPSEWHRVKLKTKKKASVLNKVNKFK